ncbi:copine-8-like [Homarus americanus]|uniref:Copine-8-like 3 n=1 Tax=Homarus americanus TaxID=6706 RepID=A0A8J5JJ13_HOMAM|nr:copine-8-like [Homarus americanus]XP_042208462.1 copine-8-like [Homarus americanus]XP_042208463.1 copine-8-like [Homarus americanus]XP_042208464.1 copine-8-like [Homarus americanus]XP_042208465.1 copine-8-like [Homarus americanus]KAG7154014.1 Copine-8-like 3 [Homarus americanus]
MAGSAAAPTSLVEITVSCRNLRDSDVFSKSDPVCVLLHQPFGSKQWTEFKRTECIDNNLNPDFATKIPITYHFEEQQNLKFMVYDIDYESQNLDHHDFLGEYACTLAHLASSRTVHKPLVNKNHSGDNGSILIVTEELNSCKEELAVQFVGKNIENRSWFFSISPFLEFFKANEDGTFTLVHRTEPAHSTENPVWKEFSAPLRSFCNGDYDRNIQVKCKNFKSSGDHKLIGSFNTTVRKLIEGPGPSNTYWIINEERKKKKGSSYKNSGEVMVNKAHVRQVYSFIDYIKGGMEINAFIAIDFTASNGNPQTPQSLHFITAAAPNQYAQAIQSVGVIIEDYDTDKYFPVLGFGAKMPPDYSQVSHEFFVNGDPSNPYCHRVQGVLEAYYQCVRRVQLYGPTNFSPIINHVARFASSNQNGEKYFILLILTDGIITDMPQTKEAIVNASALPMSIIIVGVGNADFDNMEELDGDTVRLSSNGRYASRDIVQFVPFRDFLKGHSDPHTAGIRLAREVLAEIPTQILSFMKANNIVPQPPKVNESSLPQNIE